jgi:hypothetical protein
MSLALESACETTLGLKLIDDPATRVVASKIVELAQRGVRDAATLSEMTLKIAMFAAIRHASSLRE